MLCEYGCGREAEYKMAGGKWCCSKSYNSCLAVRKKNSMSHIKIIKKQYIIGMLCDYGCGQEATHQFANGKWCCSKSYNRCPIARKNIKLNHADVSGSNNPMFNKKHTEESLKKSSKKLKGKLAWNKGISPSEISKNKMRITKKYDLRQIIELYPTFCKEEEMRYNPVKPIEEKEIQVRCKNSNCENSKEKGGWFTPTRIQWDDRRRALETDRGNDGAYLYCSQHCKDTCPLYRSHGTDPYKDQAYRSQVWNDQVLKQDESTCQICGSKENLHCHHIQPVKLEPEYALDPTNGIVLCQTCHIKYGHKVGTECSLSNLAKIVCKKKGKLYVKKTTTIKDLSE